MSRFKCLCLLAVLFVSGCATVVENNFEYRYRFTPPQDTEKLNCITQCENSLPECYRKEDISLANARADCLDTRHANYNNCVRSAELDFERCRQDAALEYMGCLKYAKEDDEEKCVLKECYQSSCSLSSCVYYTTYQSCSEAHRNCYRHCGGEVERYSVKTSIE